MIKAKNLSGQTYKNHKVTPSSSSTRTKSYNNINNIQSSNLNTVFPKTTTHAATNSKAPLGYSCSPSGSLQVRLISPSSKLLNTKEHSKNIRSSSLKSSSNNAIGLRIGLGGRSTTNLGTKRIEVTLNASIPIGGTGRGIALTTPTQTNLDKNINRENPKKELLENKIAYGKLVNNQSSSKIIHSRLLQTTTSQTKINELIKNEKQYKSQLNLIAKDKDLLNSNNPSSNINATPNVISNSNIANANQKGEFDSTYSTKNKPVINSASPQSTPSTLKTGESNIYDDCIELNNNLIKVAEVITFSYCTNNIVLENEYLHKRHCRTTMELQHI